MLDLDELEARIAEGEKRNFFVAPLVKELIAELREARGERAAVVAWLHRQGGRAAWTLAQGIERGEHRNGS